MKYHDMSDEGAGIAPLIDHTLLKADATPEQIVRLCREAAHYGFAAVCVLPAMLPLAARELETSTVKPGTVVGFPLGGNLPSVKAFEAAEAIRSGAAELDMVIAVGALKAGDEDLVTSDIAGVVQAAKGRPVKVILETCLLTDEEKLLACRAAVAAGAAFVKTSTGLAGGGATVADIRLMCEAVGPDMGVKASGGIRKRKDARKMIAAGATRLGTSSGVKIVSA